MSDAIEQMELALATLCDAFVDSPLTTQTNLSSAGLDDYSVGAGFNGWNGLSDFYGGAYVVLTRKDGTRFQWRVGVLYEQGMHDGIFWEQGAGYAYVQVTPVEEIGDDFFYSIGNTPLPKGRMSVGKLSHLARRIERLSNRCFNDLAYIYQHDLFDDLLDLGVQGINGKFSWNSNPLRSNTHD